MLIVVLSSVAPAIAASAGASRINVANAMVTNFLVVILGYVYRRYLREAWIWISLVLVGALQPAIFVLITPSLKGIPPGWLIGLVLIEGPVAIWVIQTIRDWAGANEVDLSDDDLDEREKQTSEDLLSRWK